MTKLQKTISITEDDPAVLDSLRLILERAGYDVRAESSPRHLLNAGGPFPDLYLIDKQLAGIDGIEACRHLKKHAATSDIPVIIISATPHAGRLASLAGAEGFIEKPFRSVDLLELAARLLASGR